MYDTKSSDSELRDKRMNVLEKDKRAVESKRF